MTKGKLKSIKDVKKFFENRINEEVPYNTSCGRFSSNDQLFSVYLEDFDLRIESTVGFTKQSVLPVICNLYYTFDVDDSLVITKKSRTVTKEEIDATIKVLEIVFEYWTEITKRKRKKQPYFIMKKEYGYNRWVNNAEETLNSIISGLSYYSVNNIFEKTSLHRWNTVMKTGPQENDYEKIYIFGLLVERDSILHNFFENYVYYENTYKKLVYKFPEISFLENNRYHDVPTSVDSIFDVLNLERDIEFQKHKYKVIAGNDKDVVIDKEKIALDGFIAFFEKIDEENRLKYLFDAPKEQFYKFCRKVFNSSHFVYIDKESEDKYLAIAKRLSDSLGVGEMEGERMFGRWNLLLEHSANDCLKVNLGYYKLFKFVMNEQENWYVITIEKDEWNNKQMEFYSDKNYVDVEEMVEKRMKTIVMNDMDIYFRK